MTLAAQLAAVLLDLVAGRATETQARVTLRDIAGSPQLSLVPNTESPAVEPREVAMRLYNYWRKQCNHPSARPDPTRIAKAMARLRDGFTEQELRWAIDGMAGSEHHSGANDAGKRYDDMELCFRNMRNVERFLDMARGRGQATPKDTRDEQRADMRKKAQRALAAGRRDEHDAIIRTLRST